ncbi:unnamed protein product [Miscanthus lutarioriparius]|uniref:Coiled-coil domain-containing protein n=1 Tax=Miscanthus lutarioriparius TaxID=422564 RepID=A0A811S4I2_9POAL|nr:unnamed protein product [Miscanthus lutarioriparius]
MQASRRVATRQACNQQPARKQAGAPRRLGGTSASPGAVTAPSSSTPRRAIRPRRINPLIAKGSRVTLAADQVPPVAPPDTAEVAYALFASNWPAPAPGSSKAQRPVLTALLRSFWPQFLLTAVLGVTRGPDDSLIEARSVEEAIARMSVLDPQVSLPADKHPERRLKSTFKAFEEAELPKLKEEKPGLTLHQYKDMIWKLWKKSPDNPLNQAAD